MKDVYLIIKQITNGVDTWEYTMAVANTEEIAVEIIKELESDNTDSSIEYYYIRFPVISD